MKQPKVSIIVPVYKVEKYLVQCLDSIVGQTLKDIEIIIVDEGDKDACRYIIDHYEQADKRVIAIHEKNGGYGASVNKGFDIAKGEYIGIVESDDFIAPEMYEEMYNYAKKLDADVVKTPYYEYWSQKDGIKDFKKVCWYNDFITKNSPKNKTFSILDYPHQMSIHASLWSGIYKTSYIKKEYKGLYSKVGPYLIIDEYLNTVGQCFNFFPSEEQFKLLQENLLHINDSIIDNSPVLDATQKKYILCTKYAQNRDDFFSKVHLSFRQKKKSFISIVLKLHHNHIEFNLLRNIKFPIIKFNLNLFGIIDFIFKLGK